MELEEILKYLSPVTVGLIAAFVASKFALRKFKEEKVWDERRDSYKNAIEAHEEILHWAEQVRASHCCEPIIGGEAKFDDALREISKYAATGGLVFSKEFHEIVRESNSKISKIRFQVDEESKPDMHTEQGAAEWDFHLAIEIRNIVEGTLPKLIKVATSEIPKNT